MLFILSPVDNFWANTEEGEEESRQTWVNVTWIKLLYITSSVKISAWVIKQVFICNSGFLTMK